MEFDLSSPNQEALDSLAQREIFTTDMTTAELREALDAQTRHQSFYSAQTSLDYLLEGYKEKVEALINPKQIRRADRITANNPEGFVNVGLNDAYARAEIKDLLKEMDYAPKPEDIGTLKDLSSDARINLVLRTNQDLALGEGKWVRGQNAAELDVFPAQELFRLESRKEPRFWLMRWRLAGAQTGDPIGTGWTITPDERMIALKNHDIWNWIGSSALFNDALDVVWPPFAFNSGMWVRNVTRGETEDIGLLKRGEAAPKPMGVIQALEAFTNKISKLMEAA